ncbi:MAG: hypothetical protein GXP25_06995 [Planctomycetes bacterium]|nr:hypothetical protein [Planctomycetota bacterium]
MKRFVLCVLIGAAVAANASRADTISFKTDFMRYEIKADGTSGALIDLRDGKNYLSDKPLPFAAIVIAGKRHDACGVVRDGNLLRVTFADTDVTATITVQEKAQWLVFRVTDISSNKDVEELAFLQVPTQMLPREERIISVRAGCVRTPRFAVCCQTLDLQTQSFVRARREGHTLSARCFSRFGLKGARAALFAAPTEKILDVIESLEVAEHLPHPTLDGVWARRSPDALKSYLFIDLTEANADEVIRIAKEINFGYILIYANKWATTLGSYEINKTNYPHGMEGLKAVAEKAHAEGIKVGIHCLTGFVNKRDPLVRPVPDPRLGKDGKVTLAEDIDEKTKFIPTVESPADFPNDIGYGLERQGLDVQIDDEIVSYRVLSTKPPYGLQRCIRGAYGTKRAPHKKGATVWHLVQRFANYLADCDTDLADQIAKRYADVINGCGLDMIYFDGAGANTAFGREWWWRYVPYIPLKSYSLWKREVRVGGSCSGPLYWHMRSFATCNDFVEIAVKAFFDNDKARSGRGARVNFIPVDFGWWGLHSWAPNRRATTPDEIEYVCQKTLAFDAFWSLETTLKKIKECGRWPDIKKTISTYERLRLARYFPEEIKKAIQKKGAEFKLLGSDADGWRLVPARYGPPHLVLDEKSSAWTIENDLPTQPLRFRLYALPVLSAYDSDENITILNSADMSRYVKTRTLPQCTTELSPSDQKTPAGETCVAFHAKSDRDNPAGWVEHRADLVKLGEKLPMPALIEGLPEDAGKDAKQWRRPIGVWVHGDGKGEVLNIQLRSANGGYRDHYVDVNFTGWKYCEFAKPESDRVFDFNAGYSRKSTTRHFQYHRIRSVFLRYNSIPKKAEVCCLVGPIKAIRERWLPVKTPAFTVNGEKIVFPCELKTEQYIEFMGSGPARLFDREGVEIGKVAPEGTVPILKPGENRIVFSSDAGADLSQRVDVSVIRFGETSPAKRDD